MEHRTGVQVDTRPDAETAAALQRHEARLVVLIEKRFDAPARVIEAEEGQPLTPSDPRLSQAIAMLADDTPAQWAKDQRTIEAHYLRTEGTLRYASRTYAWGSTPEDMWANYCRVISEQAERRMRVN
jgi:hypothetical protein